VLAAVELWYAARKRVDGQSHLLSARDVHSPQKHRIDGCRWMDGWMTGGSMMINNIFRSMYISISIFIFPIMR
jgi:hypothetical protein